MANVNSSAEVVRETIRGIRATISEIRGASAKVRAVGSGGWNDEQGQNFHALMQKIAKHTESPINTLQAALPKLEKLAQSLDSYNSIRFG